MNAHSPVAARLAPLVSRLGPLLGKLGSPHDGEVVSAARAIGRQLERQGLTFNDLGAALGGTPAAQAAPDAGPGAGMVLTDWRCAVQWVVSHPAWAPTERERQFIRDMSRFLKRRGPTAKQAEWITSIVDRLGGRMHA